MTTNEWSILFHSNSRRLNGALVRKKHIKQIDDDPAMELMAGQYIKLAHRYITYFYPWL